MNQAWNDPAELARQYAKTIFRLAYARTGSQIDAEDVMQEVFVRLLRARPDFDSQEHAKAWLLRVAINCTNDLFRLSRRRREQPLPDTLPAPEREEGGVVEAVLALSPKYRIVVHLYYYEELSIAEIASILGKSEGTVKSRLFRARALLRQYLEEDDNVSERL